MRLIETADTRLITWYALDNHIDKLKIRDYIYFYQDQPLGDGRSKVHLWPVWHRKQVPGAQRGPRAQRLQVAHDHDRGLYINIHGLTLNFDFRTNTLLLPEAKSIYCLEDTGNKVYNDISCKFVIISKIVTF